MEFLSGIEYWHWIIFGTVLIIIEVFAPSAILLWPGLAAILAGIAALAMPQVPAPWILTLWGLFAVILAAGWQFYKHHSKTDIPHPTINRRGEQIVGRHFTLSKDIVNGIGELHIDDTRWKIVSDYDYSAGVKVKVTAVEGTSLKVEEFLS